MKSSLISASLRCAKAKAHPITHCPSLAYLSRITFSSPASQAVPLIGAGAWKQLFIGDSHADCSVSHMPCAISICSASMRPTSTNFQPRWRFSIHHHHSLLQSLHLKHQASAQTTIPKIEASSQDLALAQRSKHMCCHTRMNTKNVQSSFIFDALLEYHRKRRLSGFSLRFSLVDISQLGSSLRTHPT